MSFNLYQLRSEHKLPVGSFFEIDGPHDEYGYVLKSTESADDNGKYYLNLVRGTGGGKVGRESARNCVPATRLGR